MRSFFVLVSRGILTFSTEFFFTVSKCFFRQISCLVNQTCKAAQPNVFKDSLVEQKSSLVEQVPISMFFLAKHLHAFHFEMSQQFYTGRVAGVAC